MNWRHYVRDHLPPLDVSAEREVEIVEELAQQLEAAFDRARAAGADGREAMARAAAEVPDWTALALPLSRVERQPTPLPVPGAASGGLMTGFVQDLRYAARALRRSPGFAAISIVTLALGIAATTVVYSLIDAILVRPLPIADPDRVVLARETVANGSEISMSWPNFLDLLARASSFAGLALLMAAIGVFGVTAYTVSQRTHELGVRLALGARPGNVLALVLRQELAVCVAGVAVGTGGAVLLSSLLESLLYGVPANDPATLAAAAAVLLAVTLIACVIPARRATRVDPVTALRLE